ncbi:hypothetical protein ACFX13_008490 [Malus domestica]
MHRRLPPRPSDSTARLSSTRRLHDFPKNDQPNKNTQPEQSQKTNEHETQKILTETLSQTVDMLERKPVIENKT